jgi:hypothetical protein
MDEAEFGVAKAAFGQCPRERGKRPGAGVCSNDNAPHTHAFTIAAPARGWQCRTARNPPKDTGVIATNAWSTSGPSARSPIPRDAKHWA